MPYSRKKLQLTGQRFGKLVVINPAENVGRRTAWHCRCDCGREITVTTGHLREGHTTSCGCRPNATYIHGTCVEMLQAKTVRKNNTSGVPGVDWRPTKRRWRASICFQGRRYNLGSFTDFEQAVSARKQAEKALHDDFLQKYAAGQIK
ncbi:hypothetical protein [Acutalibacter caecimuris]|uniref:hypothetical protein n=1 Tax=Acutalibacter caecimuris TaxID=3093657 RepID=UPI002AC9BD95|nr:hypothetical protein [Acutalibacter sp. M00118]